MTEAKKDELTSEEQEQVAGGKWEYDESAPSRKNGRKDLTNPAPEYKPSKIF